MSKNIDCVMIGSCALDLLCRPVHLDQPIGGGVLHETERLLMAGGGIVCNSGIVLARLGMKVAALSYVGDDSWGQVVRKVLTDEGIDDGPLMVHPTEASSTTVVAVDPSGERSFFHCVGAPKLLDAKTMLDHLDLFTQSRSMLFGYYSLMPNLEPDLPQVFKEVRATGCLTAMDAAGHGGSIKPLDKMLRHLDIYVPSFNEASNQTGHKDPNKIIDTFRSYGAPGLLGVKLGSKGVLLSPKPNEYVQISVVASPGKVIDTTGAGDSFYAGLIAGLLRGLSVQDAGRLGAAAAACCVTVLGGSGGGRDYETTAKLAGIES